MADDTLINTPTDQLQAQNIQSEAEKRIKQLSEKVRLTSEERDEKDRLLGESAKTIEQLTKENTFTSGFADMLGTYPLAKDHKDEIKAKVLSGLSVEDATFAVLGKAGKLGQSSYSPQVAGGSADTVMNGTGAKEIKDMSLADKRAALEKSIGWE